jgi:hypothetical protein
MGTSRGKTFGDSTAKFARTTNDYSDTIFEREQFE